MARDLPKSIPLYFYDSDNGSFTGDVGSSGDSDDFTLPPFMTEIAPPVYDDETEQAVFDVDYQTWSVKFLDDYLNMTPAEQAAVDGERAINAAQDLVISRLHVFNYDLASYLVSVFSEDATLRAEITAASDVAELKAAMIKLLDRVTLGTNELALLNGYRTKYEDWIAKKEAAEG